MSAVRDLKEDAVLRAFDLMLLRGVSSAGFDAMYEMDTHVVLAGRRDGVDEFFLSQILLSSLVICL